MGLTSAEVERLALLSEECGEVIQVIGKILRHGYESYNPTTPVDEDKHPETNRMMLEKECGDLLFCLDLLRSREDLNAAAVERHRNDKPKRAGRYLHCKENKS